MHSLTPVSTCGEREPRPREPGTEATPSLQNLAGIEQTVGLSGPDHRGPVPTVRLRARGKYGARPYPARCVNEPRSSARDGIHTLSNMLAILEPFQGVG